MVTNEFNNEDKENELLRIIGKFYTFLLNYSQTNNIHDKINVNNIQQSESRPKAKEKKRNCTEIGIFQWRFENLASNAFLLYVSSGYINNISVISWRSVLLVGETGVSRENHQPVASH